MKELVKNRHGAVTVIVTLLLIPAILICGTGVDLARIYSGRAVLQDANQLAMNSMLSEYDALLQDMYGLFAITQTDEELKELVNKYIMVSIFAEDADSSGANVLKLFDGEMPTVEIETGDGQSLANVDQLRRQIEEYAKLRAPVVIADEIIDRLESFKRVKADSAVISKKTNVEDRLENINATYKKLYSAIQELNGFDEKETVVLNGINLNLFNMQNEFSNLLKVRDEYDTVKSSEDIPMYKLDQIYDQYTDILNNIGALVSGPAYGEWWTPDSEEASTGTFLVYTECGAYGYFVDGINAAENIIPKVSAFLELCQQAQLDKEAFEAAVEELEKELDKNECTPQLKKGLTEPTQVDGKTQEAILDKYKSLVGDYDIGSLGQQFYDRNYEPLLHFKQMLENVLTNDTPLYSNTYGINLYYSNLLNADYLEGKFDINYTENNKNSAFPEDDVLELASRSFNYFISPDLKPGYDPKSYFDFALVSDEHMDFYKMLEEMYKNSEDGSKGEEKEKASKRSITAMFKALKTYYSGIIPSPEGAYKLVGRSAVGGTMGSDFCSNDKDWSDTDKIRSDMKASVNSSFLTSMSSLANDGANKLLLLAYASEMFSCYSTGRGGLTDKKTMTGTELGLKTNYYYQSELEYIINGHYSDAIANHNAVGSLILLTRMIFNYIVSFSIPSVTATVTEIEASLAFLGPFAIGIGELARFGLALGESLVDLSFLREGYMVAVIKTEKTWKFSLSSILNVAESTLQSNIKSQIDSATAAGNDLGDDAGMYYFDYVRIFLLFVDGDDMAKRIGNLIALNLTNYKENIGDLGSRESRENAMAEAQLFDMKNARTGFALTTTAEMNMLFLSMPFAQTGIDSFIPPKTKTVTATDYRGY